ncbi:DUF1559 family PulG-like putative transporter [Singulisphaera rosea]
MIIPHPSASPYESPKSGLFPDDAVGPFSGPPKTSGKAIASLVLGLCFFCNLLTGVPALVFGFLGLSDIKKSRGRLKGQGIAITGIVLGGVSCTLVPIAVLIALLLPAVQAAREAARRAQCVNNLKQIGLALHNYESAYGQLPPAASTDRDGKPLLSWRVAILPFLEQQPLYNEFKLDEPWDSPHNQPLAARMPSTFRCPSVPMPESDTSGLTEYQAIVGPGAFLDETTGTRFDSMTDGTANTLAIVESKGMVVWTKPEDIPLDNLAQSKVSSYHPGGNNSLFADGSVRFLKVPTMNPANFHALCTKNGGEVVSADSL